MLFNSYHFFIFVIIVLVCKNLFNRYETVQKIILLLSCYYFYGLWSWPYLALILTTTTVDFFVAQRIHEKRKPKVMVLTSLFVNLGILCFFKYANFFIDTTNKSLGFLGGTRHLALLNILLPVGISFYTFKSISYVIDVYRGNLKPRRNYLDYALYVSFFTNLLAGPIVRATTFFPQLDSKEKPSFFDVQEGVDLASEIYAVFRVFERKADEEATLARLLEAIKDFEGQGSNSLRDFLRFAEGREAGGAWDIDVPEGADSVRAMTIHKAKGLGFPVVIVLLYGEKNRGFGYTVTRQDGELRLVKLTRHLARGDERLGALYDEQALRDKVNKLNGLYVALTRAKEEMYVIGIKRERDSFPFDLLPEPGPVSSPGDTGPAPGVRAADAESQPVVLSHEARPVPPTVRVARLTHGERRRGDLIHAALSRILFASPDLEGDIRRALARAARAMRIDADHGDLAGSAASLIGQPPLAELFSPRAGRAVFTERELCDEEGKLVRMDRVVVDPESVTVVDWKTGAEDDQADEHEEQIANYTRILRALYPGREVRAILAYLDQGGTRSVS